MTDTHNATSRSAPARSAPAPNDPARSAPAPHDPARNASARDDPVPGDGDPCADADDGWDGGDELPRAPLGLDGAQCASLAGSIRSALGGRGCDDTLRAAQAWSRREGVGWSRLRRTLEDRGGFCDCEVLLNVLDPPG